MGHRLQGEYGLENKLDLLVEVIEERYDGDKFGVESSIPMFAFEAIARAVDRRKIILSDDLLNEMRLVKTLEEISMMQRTAKVAENATMKVIEEIRPGSAIDATAREYDDLIEITSEFRISLLPATHLGKSGADLHLDG